MVGTFPLEDKGAPSVADSALTPVDKGSSGPWQDFQSPSKNDDNSEGANKTFGWATDAILILLALWLVRRWWRSVLKARQERAARLQQAEQLREAEAQQRETKGQREAEAQQRETERRRRDPETQQEQGAPSKVTDKPREWWEVLGVPMHATLEEITRQYRQGMRLYHPDRVSGLAPEIVCIAEQRTKELNAAYAQARRLRTMN